MLSGFGFPIGKKNLLSMDAKSFGKKVIKIQCLKTCGITSKKMVFQIVN